MTNHEMMVIGFWGFTILLTIMAVQLLTWPFFLNYRFSPAGIDITTFGKRIRLSQIKREDIKEIIVLSRFDVRHFGASALFARRWHNRIYAKYTFIIKTSKRRYALTPDNADEALRELEWHSR